MGLWPVNAGFKAALKRCSQLHPSHSNAVPVCFASSTYFLPAACTLILSAGWDFLARDWIIKAFCSTFPWKKPLHNHISQAAPSCIMHPACWGINPSLPLTMEMSVCSEIQQRSCPPAKSTFTDREMTLGNEKWGALVIPVLRALICTYLFYLHENSPPESCKLTHKHRKGNWNPPIPAQCWELLQQRDGWHIYP